MPTNSKKKSSKSAGKKNVAVPQHKKENSFAQLQLSESYTSLVLGIIVVFVFGLFVFIFAKHKTTNGTAFLPTAALQKSLSGKTKSTKISSANPLPGSSYTVQDNESLWDIAVKAYGDGYRWPDIVKANNLDNPDQISSGMIIKIPR